MHSHSEDRHTLISPLSVRGSRAKDEKNVPYFYKPDFNFQGFF